eukprot:gene109-9_t
MIRPGSAAVKSKKPAQVAQNNTARAPASKKSESLKPNLEEFVKNGDYVGAITVLEFEKKAKENRHKAPEWLAFCYYHNGDFHKALDIYSELSANNTEAFVYQACCHYGLCEYDEAKDAADKAPPSALRTRVLFHVAHKLNDEANMLKYHQDLSDTVEDQLCLAAIQYLR